MHRQNDQSVLRNIRQILAEPLQSRLGDLPFIIGLVLGSVGYVVDSDEVALAVIERPVDRAESVFEYIVGILECEGPDVIVVVPYHMEYRESELYNLPGIAACHVIHLVPYHISQGQADHRPLERTCVPEDLRHDPVLELRACIIMFELYVGQDEQCEILHPSAPGQGEIRLYRLVFHEYETVIDLRQTGRTHGYVIS